MPALARPTATLASSSARRTAAAPSAGARRSAALLPVRSSVRSAASARRTAAKPAIRAAATPSSDDGVVAIANKIGLDTTEGLFGFTPFAELWVGRLAMIGFLCAVIGEGAGHGGALAQLGLPVPSAGLTAVLGTVFGGLTLASTLRTLYEASSGSMTPADRARYGALFGVRPADLAAQARAGAELKSRGDFTSPTSFGAIAAAKAAGTPADAVLGADSAPAIAGAAAAARAATEAGPLGGLTVGDLDAAKAERAPGGPSVSLAGRDDALEASRLAGGASWDYARDVELNNGRAAMLGFLAACVVESATGLGVLGQLIEGFKAVGLLGSASGF